ncbi:Gfo/Idh/MocA family protein [Halomarina salina]|uniref:Gfo/Idh/MocA family protein n=1 Tax=Halomarina salina TaxID=1872699 RepID=A0ABD5RHJ0_9EURY|nr:Gfo/Idh/MocA family oxidoreductase [Halomarina salina]
MPFDVAFVGTGATPDDPDRTGFAMAYRHAAGYDRLENCRLVACADIVRENAEAFADRHDIDSENVYEHYEELLAEVEPDIVSVCVPPAVHAPIVVDCAESGIPKAVHCEKPMATTWADSRRMKHACSDAGVQLTINHQLRFGRPVREAKRLLDEGAIGDLRRVEFAEEHLYDTGSHSFDLCHYFAGDRRVDWVLGQLEYSEENCWFGEHNENQAITQWRYENGVFGLGTTGDDRMVDCYLRLRGTDGCVEIRSGSEPLRIRQDGRGWRQVDTGDDRLYGPQAGLVKSAARSVLGRVSSRADERLGDTSYTQRGIEDLVTALETGTEPTCNASAALAADELVFATWESVRRRGRVDLPLLIDDNPLTQMVESGALELESSG